ncbi:hypothetical protein [Nocardia aurantiaca]|uniref:Uncharacterized protein n=1 Tax=Nocardia aurantiaca TaxID=2675850 RepID=A0A6I3KSA3_9NOCA|nr:hypothetical protein [Nocardia aurantiaca]MTE12822.1 hypothetical protein [Nocardia aurantiaca]
MDGSNAGADERAVTPLRHLPKPVAGAAAAVGAVSAGLILLGACGIGHDDTYVAPPPISADLQAAPSTSTKSGSSTTPGVIIPPSPTWRVAADMPSRRAPISTVTATPEDPAADPSASARTTPSRPTTTESTRPTTELPATTVPATTLATTDHAASDDSDG